MSTKTGPKQLKTILQKKLILSNIFKNNIEKFFQNLSPRPRQKTRDAMLHYNQRDAMLHYNPRDAMLHYNPRDAMLHCNPETFKP